MGRKQNMPEGISPFYPEVILLSSRDTASGSNSSGMLDIKQTRVRSRKRWLIALATLPLFGMVAAFGTAPDTLTSDIVHETTVEAITLPAPAASDSGNFDFWREERIRAGDNLQSLLARMGVAEEETQTLLVDREQLTKLGKLVPGRSILARVTSSGRLLLVRYMIDDAKMISIERVAGQFVVQEQSVQIEPTMVMRSGVITHSLFGATDDANVPDSIASEMAEALSGEIDFHRDLRKGDRFSVVYEAYLHEGRLIKTGRLMAAEFTNNGRLVQALNFIDSTGNSGYFTPDGRSLKRAFLKSPLPFTRITSGFTAARYHPVLKEWRAHRGIDYGAPTGTPVRGRVGCDGQIHRQAARLWQSGTTRACQALQYRIRPFVSFRRRSAQRQPGHPGSGHRLRRHDRSGDRTAFALRVPRQGYPAKPSGNETAQRLSAG
jgi:murein DD-endopeptidase MepM/ murein hydrolase activator NlpD